MNIKLVVIGETNNKNLKVLSDQYIDKLKHYIKFDLIIIKDHKKKLPESIQIKKEGEKILSILKKNEFIILLDENGEHKSSVAFSKFIQKKLNSGIKIVGIIGLKFKLLNTSGWLELKIMTIPTIKEPSSGGIILCKEGIA